MNTIEPATAASIPVLRDLADRIWHEYYPGIISLAQIDYMLERMYAAETIQHELAAGVVWEILRREAEGIGFHSYAFDNVAGRVKLNKLYVLPAFHGQGIGRQMIEHVRVQAALGGAREIHLQVNKRNTRAIRAYERAGFQVRESVVADIGGGFGMDDFLMTLPILTQENRQQAQETKRG